MYPFYIYVYTSKVYIDETYTFMFIHKMYAFHLYTQDTYIYVPLNTQMYTS